ncbi:MAG: glycosyltransferase family 39 protein [Oscillospiraceae bacterium]|nr:glycosyltransferase family 39 protein [Oscillospiraceae bacterium]
MKKVNKKFYIMLLVEAIVIAVFVRVYQFGLIPGGMNQDGAMAAVDAKALADYGTDRFGMRWPVHLTAWGFGQMSALLSYLMIVPIKLFGLSVFSARLPMLLVSLTSLGVLYCFARNFAGKNTALVVLLLAVINPWHIMQSRWALDCNLFPHFVLAGVFALQCGVEREKGWLYGSMVFFSLSMYCYGISIYTVPLFLLAASILLLRRRKVTIWQVLGCVGIYLLIAWPFLACMIINALQLPTIETPLFTIPYFPYSMRSNDILFFSAQPFSQLQQNAVALLKILFQVYSGPRWNEIRGFGTLYVFSTPFMLIGIMLAFRRYRKNIGAALTVLWFLTGVAAGLITANVNINRINIIFYPMILFTAIGIWGTMRFLGEKKGWKIVRLALPLAYCAAFCLFVNTYFTTYAAQAADDFMQDFGEAVTAIKGAEVQKVYISADAQYKGYGHVSEILTLFYMDIDSKEYQNPEFHQQFTFQIPFDPNPEEDAVYVAATDDLSRFPPELYDIEPHGKFSVVVPRFADN